MGDRLVLVTGANGYIASRLIPRLLERGYHVRVMVRKPERLAGRSWLPQVEVRSGSTSDMNGLTAIMQDVDTAYYLIHNMASGRGYMEVERESARRFAAAAGTADVKHIIYLGGLADAHDPHLAPHMRSRIETGEILRQGRVPVTEFRAGVIVGAGSISFEMVRFLTECFPVLPGPTWLHNKAQPIASENVIDYLLAGLEKAEARGAVYEMGGPEQMQFGEVMLRFARYRGLRRRLYTLPGIPIWWMALFVDRLTPVPYPIATALVGGLQSDSRVLDNAARRAFPEVKLVSYEDAVKAALTELSPARLERVWEGYGRDAANFRHEGFIVDYRVREVEAPAEAVFEQLTQLLGGSQPWPYAHWLWRLRGWLDALLVTPNARNDTGRTTDARGSAHGIRAGNPGPGASRELDYYRVEAADPARLLRLHSSLHAPGSGWLEWRVEPQTATNSRLIQTAFFSPRGFPGFLYWLVLGPVHQLILRGMVGGLKKRSEAR